MNSCSVFFLFGLVVFLLFWFFPCFFWKFWVGFRGFCGVVCLVTRGFGADGWWFKSTEVEENSIVKRAVNMTELAEGYIGRFRDCIEQKFNVFFLVLVGFVMLHMLSFGSNLGSSM